MYDKKTWDEITKDPATRREPCRMCNSALVSDYETPETDFQSIGIGFSEPFSRLCIDSGAGKPVRIEFWQWSEKTRCNEMVACYFPKYCPNCGRRLSEYKITDELGAHYEKVYKNN